MVMGDEQRLQALKNRIDAANAPTSVTSNSTAKQTHAGITHVTRVISELFAGVLTGGIVGYVLDRWLETTPWLFILCFFLGCAASAKTIYRTTAIDRTQTHTQPSEADHTIAKQEQENDR